MNKPNLPANVKSNIVSKGLSILLQRLNYSKKNAKALLALIEKIECDADLTAAEKKLLISKINSYYLLSTAELIDIVNKLSDSAASAFLPEQVLVTMDDEVKQWAM